MADNIIPPTVSGSNNFTGYIRFTYKPTSSSVQLFQISPPTMTTLAADGVPPQPPHPTMPPYALRETDLHSSELNFPVEQPSKPKKWDKTLLGTKSHAEPTPCPTTTMAISTKTDRHDTTLPTLFSPPTESVSTLWRHNHIAIANGMDRTYASQQHDTQCGTRTSNDNLQLPATLPHTQSTNQGPTGHNDDSQCHITGDRLMQQHTILQKVPPTPNSAHADTTTSSYTKTKTKITLQLPQQQSKPYCTNAIIQTAMGTIDSTTTAYHQNSHPCTQHGTTQPTQPPTNAPITNASAASYSYFNESATVPHPESLIRQHNNPYQPEHVQQRPPQMLTDFPKHAPDTPNGRRYDNRLAPPPSTTKWLGPALATEHPR